MLTIAVCIVSLSIYFLWSKDAMNIKNLSGEILMKNPHLTGIHNSKSNIVKFNPSNKKYMDLDISCSSPYFSNDKNRVLGIQGPNKIVEYDLKNLNYAILYSDENVKNIFNPKYVPNHNEISFIENNKLQILNLENKEISDVTQVDSNSYTWSKDGNKIYFDDEKGISCIDYVNLNKKEFKNGARNPIMSDNGEYLAYRVGHESLVITELNTGEEWKYNTTSLVTYDFSPNGNYIAIIEEGAELPYFFNGQKMLIWDFKNNKKTTVISNVGDAANTNIDWK